MVLFSLLIMGKRDCFVSLNVHEAVKTLRSESNSPCARENLDEESMTQPHAISFFNADALKYLAQCALLTP